MAVRSGGTSRVVLVLALAAGMTPDLRADSPECTFGPHITYCGVGDSPLSGAVGDLDGDNDNDIAMANEFSDVVSILLNNGDGTFTASDDGVALEKASQFMKGGQRAGTVGETMPEEERAALEQLSRIELVDVSRGKQDRGFDVAGRRYWFSHAWVASDVVLAIRTRLPAPRRGLEPSAIRSFWYFPPDFPERVRAAARDALGNPW